VNTRLIVRAAVPVTLSALVLAGCGSSSSGGKSSSNGGSGSGGGPTYTIAYQGPLSGGNAQLGINMVGGVKLAIQQANAGQTFGKLPFKLAFQQEDDQGSPTAAPAAVAKTLQISNLIAVVGPAFSGATRASEPTYAKAGVASVSPSATAPDLATSGWHNFFRVVADDNAQGPADAAYLGKGLKVKSTYVIDDASAYGSPLAKAFMGAAASNGLTVTKHETVPGTTQCQAGNGNVQQYGPVAQKVAAAHPDAVFYAGYYCDFALLAKSLHSAGYKGKLVSDDGSKDPKFVSQAGSAVAEGAYMSCACQGSGTTPEFKSFETGYQQIAGQPVGTYSAEAYDATNTIISVMKAKGANVKKSDVIDGLHASGFSYKGITKTVTFQSNGNVSGNAVYIYQVKSGQIAQLGLVSQLTGG
jgi:branched-chain amino acid transport system substrate-binding protein